MMNEPLIQHDQQASTSSINGSFPSYLITYLYVAHFLARWGARMWEFSVGLYMIKIWPNSLLFAAIYGVLESASTALFGPIVGNWVNSLTYVKVLQLWLVSQNLCFIVAGGTMVVLLVNSSALKLTHFSVFILLVILTNISGAVAVLSTLAVISKDKSSSPQQDDLTKMNSVIRRIDLSCKLFAPVITGFIISFVSLKASAMSLAIWNTISVWLEYWLFISVYKGIPALQESNHKRALNQNRINTKLVSSGSYLKAWRVYLKQDTVLPGIALALLFFTWICLLVCVGSILWTKYGNNDSNNISSWYMLMGGVALSRLGLWSFDLSVIQLMQDGVAERDRCVVGGVQNSLQSIMDLMGFLEIDIDILCCGNISCITLHFSPLQNQKSHLSLQQAFFLCEMVHIFISNK
ncbi:hypothetical protein F8388_022089 [Cannabis sativa]|uniref:Solute carrier family 40 member n=1 Tax=Cannabis sativa TaxID=3483 RepID=A0A7J6G877_CANSA|nr:hypothetical protein F8388_022089 [Cannabis sativa]